MIFVSGFFKDAARSCIPGKNTSVDPLDRESFEGVSSEGAQCFGCNSTIPIRFAEPETDFRFVLLKAQADATAGFRCNIDGEVCGVGEILHSA